MRREQTFNVKVIVKSSKDLESTSKAIARGIVRQLDSPPHFAPPSDVQVEIKGTQFDDNEAISMLKDVAHGMSEIGGHSLNAEEFYSEFDARARLALGVPKHCLNDEIIDVLDSAIQTISCWHAMGNESKNMTALWETYKKSPEMKKILDLIDKLKKLNE